MTNRKSASAYPLDLAGLIVLATAFSVLLFLGLSTVQKVSWIGVAFVLVMIVSLYLARRRKVFRLEKSWFFRFRIRTWNWPKTLFLLLLLAALAGGLMYPPGNYDGLTYRIPRSLRWLSEGSWQWLHSFSPRINTRAIGFECISTVWISIFRSDRYLFLINFFAFSALPSLVFSTFRRLGISGRRSWLWMWILPGGYCFALQAGSIGNDSIGAFFALAAVHFALRCRESRNLLDFSLSVLAVALTTNSKTSNLPLVLPWLVAIVPSFLLPFRKPSQTVGFLFLCAAAAICSFLPNAIMNQAKSGEWSGIKIENPGLRVTSPLVGITTNAASLLVQNAAPPVFPFAGAWNRSLPEWLPPVVYQNFTSDIMRLTELQSEETAGLGFGLTWMLVIWCGLLGFSFLTHRPRVPGFRKLTHYQQSVLVAPYFCLLVYMAKSGVGTAARIVTPYYCLLIPLILQLGQSYRWSESRYWRAGGVASLLLAFFALSMTPARPLWPAVTLLKPLAEQFPGSQAIHRAQDVYEIYRNRSDVLRPVREKLPPEARTIGYISSGDDQETSLWRPFGSRKIVEFLKNDSPEYLQQQGIRYVVAGERGLIHQFNSTSADLVNKLGWSVFASLRVRPKASSGTPETWIIYKIP